MSNTPATTRGGSLPSVAGWPFLVSSFIGRMPPAMLQLGYLMVLAADGRGLATAGLAVAAIGLGSAVGAPLLGRLVDALGPLRVVAGATLVSLAAQVCFLVGLLQHAPSWVLLAIGAVVGAANPQIGAVARMRWSHLAAMRKDPALISRALGYEGAVDEASFVLGPVLAGSVVSAFGPVVAVVGIASATLLGQGLFLAHLWSTRRRWEEIRRAPAAVATGRVPVFRVALPMLAVLGVGMVFGATQTGLTNMYELRQTPGWTGLVYGAVGIGSGVASLLVGRLAVHVAPQSRVLGGAVLAALAGAGYMLLPSIGWAFALALVLGVGVGVTLVSSFSWMEAIAPRHLVATMMTFLSTCITLGVSLGAAVSGRLAVEPAHAFAPVVAAGVLSAVASVGMWAVRPRA